MKEQHKKESPILSLLGMGGGGTGVALGGAAGPKTYVDDVFSTFLHVGNNTARSINNGIDVSGEGGLVWLKCRTSGGTDYSLSDTARGNGQTLKSNSSNGQFLVTDRISGFNSSGFTLGTGNPTNQSGRLYVSWTFRKQKGFFDVVTYTGNSTARTIAHNLGSVPGMIIIKRTDSAENWVVYHRSVGNGQRMYLNANGSSTATGSWNNTTPTATHFSLGTTGLVNYNNGTFVAYIFAHDEASFGTDGDESIVKCGTYAGNGGTQNINLGFEPQWLLVKSSTAGYDWAILDNMRGIRTGLDDQLLQPNGDNEEYTQSVLDLTSTGFITTSNANVNANGHTYVYMAIRRPNKPPELATNVFAMDVGSASSNTPTYDSGFIVDFAFKSNEFSTRLAGGKDLQTYNSNQEGNNGNLAFDSNLGWGKAYGSNSLSYMFRRAPGFMDVVTYTGKSNTAGLNVNHNLGVVPELVFFKRRDGSKDWFGYSSVTGTGKILYLNTSLAAVSNSSFIATTPTSTELTVNSYSDIFNQDSTYVAYLFATLPGISKVGSYTGTGNAINVPCGFTNGARFILIKRTDGSGNVGDWYYWDTYRGIGSGNDSYRRFNVDAGDVTNTDYVDPLTSGFTVTASAPAALNASGGTYLFLAIA